MKRSKGSHMKNQSANTSPTAGGDKAPSPTVAAKPEWMKRVEAEKARMGEKFKAVAPWLERRTKGGEVTRKQLQILRYDVDKLLRLGSIVKV